MIWNLISDHYVTVPLVICADFYPWGMIQALYLSQDCLATPTVDLVIIPTIITGNDLVGLKELHYPLQNMFKPIHTDFVLSVALIFPIAPKHQCGWMDEWTHLTSVS